MRVHSGADADPTVSSLSNVDETMRAKDRDVTLSPSWNRLSWRDTYARYGATRLHLARAELARGISGKNQKQALADQDGSACKSDPRPGRQFRHAVGHSSRHRGNRRVSMRPTSLPYVCERLLVKSSLLTEERVVACSCLLEGVVLSRSKWAVGRSRSTRCVPTNNDGWPASVQEGTDLHQNFLPTVIVP